MYNELYHHGILGQKWGVRRFQQKNGKLTAAGKKRYEDSDSKPEVEKPKADNRSYAEKTKALQEETAYIQAKLSNERAQKEYAAAHAKGKSAVQKAFEEAGKKAANELASKASAAIGNAIAEEIKKKINPKSEAQKALEALENETKSLKAQFENEDYKAKLTELRSKGTDAYRALDESARTSKLEADVAINKNKKMSAEYAQWKTERDWEAAKQHTKSGPDVKVETWTGEVEDNPRYSESPRSDSYAIVPVKRRKHS